MLRAEAAVPEAPPDQDPRRKIVLLRAMLVVAVGGLLIDVGVQTAGLGALALVLVFSLSDVVLAVMPLRQLGSRRFELVLGAADLLLVGLGIHLAGAAAGALPISCLLMVVVVALGSNKTNAVAGAAAVAAMHAWLVFSFSSGAAVGRQLALQTLFLCAVGLYYGFLTERIHRVRRKKDAEKLERREIVALMEILDTVTSSLDLPTVARGIVDRLNAAVPSVRCSLLYIDQSTSQCTVLASHDDPELDMLEIDLNKYPEIRQAIQTRRPVIVEDVNQDPLMREVLDLIADLNLQSIIVVPLTFGDDLLGTLCLKATRTTPAFSDSEVKLCTAVAGASANALKNALLHGQVVEESARRRTTGEKLGRILDHSPDLILTTDVEGRILEFNQAAERLLGHTKDEVRGRPADVLLQDQEDRGLVRRALADGALPNHRCQLSGKNGVTLEVELQLALLKDESGQVMGAVWIGRDLTELRAAQLQLLQREKLSTIGEVISGVAHELSNPLSAVLGYSQLLLARHRDARLARELEKINDGAVRCQKIVKNLLSFARAHKPERKYLGVNGIIEKTLDLRKYQLHVNNIEVLRELEPDLPRTMLDFHQLQQVFLNLINNAQHAMATVRDRPGQLVVRTASRNGTIRVEVSDNGEGMDKETLERIFDPFFTTKEQGQGTGLGLSVSYGIVKEHEGRIHARSVRGRGSTFIVELPVVQEETEADQADANSESVTLAVEAGAGSHILVVDDEPVIIDLMIDILEEMGHRVDTAANGNEACAKIGARPYDLVITDIRMPQMNGLDLYRNILSKRPELEGKVVFITGDLVDDEIVRFLAEVNARTIPKPLEISKVTEVVRDLSRTPSQ